MTNINIFLDNTYKEYKIDETEIYNDILKMSEFFFANKSLMEGSCLNDYKFESIDFDIVFVDNKEIQRINKEYRQKDLPTDVITFAIFADSLPNERFIMDGEISLGEIIVSLDKIDSQSKENNVTFKEELYYIIAHGILHLLGFDHLTQDDYNYMVKWQNKAKDIVYDKV